MLPDILFHVCCCAGVYVLLSTTQFGKKQRETLRQLIKVLCLLQRKRWTLDDLDELQGEVIKAVCMVEAYLPVNQMDIKLHDLIHLTGKIYDTGPLWVTAMWVYEGMWKLLLAFCRNQAHPELSLQRSFADYEAAMYVFWRDPEAFSCKAIDTFNEACVEAVAAQYSFLRDRDPSGTVEVQAGNTFKHVNSNISGDTRLALHMYYVQWHDL